VLCALACAAAPGAARAAPTLPAGFERITLAAQLDRPTAIDWAPDGRMFIAEMPGVVKVVNPGAAPEAAPVLDISRRVTVYGDRGLLGLAVAHDFARTGHLYLLYTHEIDRRHQDGRKTSLLTRVTVGPDNRVRGKERVILGKQGSKPCRRLSNVRDCIPANAPQHSIGTVRAARDGTLWLGNGDATGDGVPYQRVFDATRVTTLAGKLIHIDGRGRGLEGHPFCPRDTDLTHVCTKIHARGFRNPFRFTLHRGTPIVGDVGLETREEIDVVRPGLDYGWPCHEGTVRTPAFALHWRCLRRYEGRRPAAPLYDYPGSPGTVVVGPVLPARAWPRKYRGQLFFGDFTRSFISTLDVETGAAAPFGTGVGATVAIERSPRGQLAYVDIAAGEVREIAWSPDNHAPVAGAVASRTSGPLPLLVNFSAAGSTDREGGALSYRWSFGDGATATGRYVSHAYTSEGNFTVRMTVSDPAGRRAVKLLQVSPGNTPPAIELVAPAAGSLYRAGTTLALRARATDAEDGELPDRAIRWSGRLDHRGHQHYFANGLTGSVAGFRVTTDHTADSFFVVTVTATDSGELESSETVEVHPRTATVTIDSSPAGAPVGFAGGRAPAPVSGTHTVGFETVLLAARSFEHDGERFRFVRWSDGGRRERAVRVPAAGLDVRARYERAG